MCECGSSLYGWIEEAMACDLVFEKGQNIDKINGFEYIASDISDFMNEGAQCFHSGVKMSCTTADTIAEVAEDVQKRLHKNISLFYGLSVSVRYAVRRAADLINMADSTELSIYNRLSVTFDNQTLTAVYGTGKSIYMVSLPELIAGFKEKGIYAKYCTANMQWEKDGEHTVRVSMVISKSQKTMESFIKKYNECIDKSILIPGVEKGEWKDLEELQEER